MSVVTGDPAAMRAAAAQLRFRAETVGATVATVDGGVAGMTYAGPAADAFRNQIATASRTLRDVSVRMTSVADRLSREAAVVEAQLLQLAREQR